MEERMAIELDLTAARSQGGAQDGLALKDVGRILFQRSAVEIDVGVGVAAEIGAGVEPEVEDLT